MKNINLEPATRSSESGYKPVDKVISQLVGTLFEAAPAAERGHLLAQLLQPLGVLSLVAVADGIFAKIRFGGGWPDVAIRLEDAQSISRSDVIALVDFVQQVSIEAVEGLAQSLMSSPMFAGSAAVALLLSVLLQRRGQLNQ